MTQLKDRVKKVTVTYPTWDGMGKREKAVADMQNGRYIRIILLANGNLHMRLTARGRQELREKLAARAEAEARLDDAAMNGTYQEMTRRVHIDCDEAILADLLEDFTGNGWGFALSFGEDWEVALGSGCSALSDDYTYSDGCDCDGIECTCGRRGDYQHVFSRVWYDATYPMYPTVLERLQRGDLIYTWLDEEGNADGTVKLPSPMRLW